MQARLAGGALARGPLDDVQRVLVRVAQGPQLALHIIERPAGQGAAGQPGLHVRSATSSIHAPALDSVPSVVVASEELDGESGWRMLAPGELVHVRPDLTVLSSIAVPQPPARLVPLGPDNPNIDT